MRMKIYSIVRIGSEYVVQAGEAGVLKVATRRRAVQVISDASELLAIQLAPPLPGPEQVAPSIASDPGPDPSKVMPDPPESMPDRSGVIPDRSEVS
jgi:hypothetical protein